MARELSAALKYRVGGEDGTPRWNRSGSTSVSFGPKFDRGRVVDVSDVPYLFRNHGLSTFGWNETGAWLTTRGKSGEVIGHASGRNLNEYSWRTRDSSPSYNRSASIAALKAFRRGSKEGGVMKQCGIDQEARIAHALEGFSPKRVRDMASDDALYRYGLAFAETWDLSGGADLALALNAVFGYGLVAQALNLSSGYTEMRAVDILFYRRVFSCEIDSALEQFYDWS